MADLFYNFSWQFVQEPLMGSIFAEFADHGVSRLVYNDPLIKRSLSDPDFSGRIVKKAREYGIRFGAMHAPCGPDFDLNCTNHSRRPDLVEDHKKAMRINAECGGKTYTIHVGAGPYCREHLPLEFTRPLALDTLEKLLPEAEKLGLVIAVENSFEKTNTSSEVKAYVEHFKGHPNLGICYDSGHAHFIEHFPGKEKIEYPDWFKNIWWEGVEEQNNAIETLSPCIVTTHMHDNHGYDDEHIMPGDGSIDWKVLIPKIKACPKMMEYQTEINYAKGYSIAKTVNVFHSLGF